MQVAAALEPARAAYESGQYEACAQRASDAVTRDEHLYVGLCHFALGQPGDAARHFNAALDLDAGSQLPPFSSPKVVAFFSTLKEQRPRVDLASATRAFEAGQLDEAARQLAVVERAPLTASEGVQARLLEGALAFARGDVTRADGALRAALALDGRAAFGFRVSAELAARFAGLRAPVGSTLGPRVLVPGVLGIALLVGGGVSYGLAQGGTAALRAGDASVRSPADLQRKNEAIRVEQTLGFVLGGAGLAALGTAGVLWATGREAPVALVADGTQWRLVVSGRW